MTDTASGHESKVPSSAIDDAHVGDFSKASSLPSHKKRRRVEEPEDKGMAYIQNV